MKQHAFASLFVLAVTFAVSLLHADQSPLAALPWIGDGQPDRNGADWYEEDPAPEFEAEFVLPPAAAPLLEDAPYAAAAVLVPDDCLRDEAAGLTPPAPFAEYSPLSAARPAALVFVFTAVLRTDGFFFMVFLDLFSACDT